MSQWLNAEALAQYIVGALTTALIVLGWWLFKRKRARYILCREAPPMSLMFISSAVRERITVILDKEAEGGEQIANLSQLAMEIFNTSRETIDNIELRFFFDLREVRLLNIEFYPPEEMQWQDDDSPLFQLESESRIRVSLPYLNPFKVYRQKAILTVLADGYPRITKVVGGGRDWKVQYLSYEERLKQMRPRFSLRAIGTLTAVFIAFVIINWAFLAYLSPALSLSSDSQFISGVIMAFIFAGVFGRISTRLLFQQGRAIRID